MLLPPNQILRCRPDVKAFRVGEDQIYLLGERERFLLSGRIYAALLEVIDGKQTVESLCSSPPEGLSPPEVLFALHELKQRGYLIEVLPDLPLEEAAFWQGAGVAPAVARDRLAANPVAVLAVSGEDPAPLAYAMQAARLVLDDRAALRVIVVDEYRNPALDDFARRAREEGFLWLPARLRGVEAWVGPVFGVLGRACWACLSHRLHRNRPVERFLARRGIDPADLSLPLARLPGGVALQTHFAAMTLHRWVLDGGQGAIDEHLLSFDAFTTEKTSHPVVRRPQCPACGDPSMLEKRQLAPIQLKPRSKRFIEDGGYRSVTPEETVAVCMRQLSPITGLLTSVGPATQKTHPLRPVFAAGYVVCPPGTEAGPEDFDRTSFGKGRTSIQSRASALCEGLERVSAEYHEGVITRRASFQELGEEAVHPQLLQNFSEAQFLTRKERGSMDIRRARRRVPLPFEETKAIDWTPAWSLSQNARRYLPTSYCYASTGIAPDEDFCTPNPNGHAAGNNLEEAILQGFLELVERDSVALWWYNCITRPGLDLGSFSEPYFVQLKKHFQKLGWQLWALDITTDIEIPAVVALACQPSLGRFAVGFGCHLEARLATQRALTELNQIFDPDCAQAPPWESEKIENPAYLYPDPNTPAKRYEDFVANRSGSDLQADLQLCLDRVSQAGLEMIVMDQSLPDAGIFAAKVVVPGLRHFWPRFGPGRLYDVPVSLGWRKEPLKESELNPVELLL